MDFVINTQGLSKRYFLNTQAHGSLKDTLSKVLPFTHNHSTPIVHKEFWALKDVTFTVKTGEIIGIIGHNGSGKSTLLKILSRVTTPTEGYSRINGRMQSLLEVGTGFHPDLTGRENIFLSCAIYGMSEKETRKILDSVIHFSGVEEFIDIPVKFYSTGMGVRLAFSVSTHVRADIILLDEVWSVGDQDFQKKSFAKIKELMSGGLTVLTVSHSPEIIKEFCTRILMLEHGRLIDDIDLISDKELPK